MAARTETTSRAADSRSAEIRLTEALSTLTEQALADNTARDVTVTKLCQLAHISRNSLYRYHRGILKNLRTYRRRHCLGAPIAVRLTRVCSITGASR